MINVNKNSQPLRNNRHCQLLWIEERITIFEGSSTEQESGTWFNLARWTEFIRSAMAGYDWATSTSVYRKELRKAPVYQ